MNEADADEPKFLEHLDKAVELFDRLLRNVAPTRRCNDSKPDKIALELDKLSDSQCQEFKNLCGYLIKLKEETNCYRSRSERYRTLEAIPNPWLKYHSEEVQRTEESLRHTIALQRNYLVQELCRGEELEMKLKAREDLLVAVTAEKDIALKKLITLQQKSSELSEEEREAINATVESGIKSQVEENPDSLVDCYVHKQFGGKKYFGIICRYKHPYFTVSITLLVILIFYRDVIIIRLFMKMLIMKI